MKVPAENPAGVPSWKKPTSVSTVVLSKVSHGIGILCFAQKILLNFSWISFQDTVSEVRTAVPPGFSSKVRARIF